MTYKEALDFIHGTHRFGSKLGLENIKVLMKALDNPQNDLKFIHVAGTNGKGSTCAMINAILMAAGLNVGLYTSPYIEVYNERMRVNNAYIDDDHLARLTERVRDKIIWMVENGYNHPTEFEVGTAIALLYFKEMACDLVVLEVGLGGRLDATNVIDTPLVSVITPLDFDHVEFLGDTIAKIAAEKAGIIKPNVPLVVYPQPHDAMQVIQDVCQRLNSPCVEVSFDSLKILSNTLEELRFEYQNDIYTIKLIAPYQAQNAVMAIEAIKALRGYAINGDHIRQGLIEAAWPARMEIIHQDPLVIIDGAHNLHGIQGLASSMKPLLGDRKVIAVLGILADKDYNAMLETILPLVHKVIATQPNNPRALKASELYQLLPSDKRLSYHEIAHDAVKRAIEDAKHEDAVVIAFGSLYLVGEVKSFFH